MHSDAVPLHAPDRITLESAVRARLLHAHEPQLSIVMPVWNNVTETARAIASIVACDPAIVLQLIVVDDGSSDTLPHALAKLPGLDFIRNGRRLGTARSANRGAGLARAPYLLFVHSGTTLVDGAMRTALRRLQSDSSIGIVGPKVLHPDGRLQAAGGAVGSDATLSGVGDGSDRDGHAFGYLREVDYVPATAFFIATDLFRALDGFDERYAPGTYEDADLCFRVRRNGRRVVYEPRSIVVHDAEFASRDDAVHDVARITERNRETFRALWPTAIAQLRSADTRRTVLFVASAVPAYDGGSESRRQYALVTALVESGFAVRVFPADLAVRQPGTHTLQQLGVHVVYAGPSDTRAATEQFADALDGIDAVWIVGSALLETHASAVTSRDCAVILDMTTPLDGNALREARAQTDATVETSPELADVTIVGTLAERDALHRRGLPDVAYVPSAYEIEIRGTFGFANTDGLLSCGEYDDPAAVDALLFLIGEIMPLVWSSLPSLTLTIVGDGAPDSVRALCEPRVMLAADASLAHGCRAARLFVAPYRDRPRSADAVCTAMTYGLPVVTTHRIAGLLDPAALPYITMVDSATELAAAISVAVSDEALWNRLSRDTALALAPSSFESVRGQAVRVIDEVLSRRGTRGRHALLERT